MGNGQAKNSVETELVPNDLDILEANGGTSWRLLHSIEEHLVTLHYRCSILAAGGGEGTLSSDEIPDAKSKLCRIRGVMLLGECRR